jgi:retron-type reverse transcriptase
MTLGIVAGGGRPHCNDEYSILLRKKYVASFAEVVTKGNLYKAWNDFLRGKRKRSDVNEFASRIADNLGELYEELISATYVHGAYVEYMVCDPKKRIIHKASVRDRVVHRLLYNALYPYFDRRFIHDSYSCRNKKGTHKTRQRFRQCTNQVSENYTKQCYVLKFDIKKCFASIDLEVLKEILDVHIADERLQKLAFCIIDSFEQGLPLGNLTSQLFVNIYLHELDWYVKQLLDTRCYLRYADDIVIVDSSPEKLQTLMKVIETFVAQTLHLQVHKVQIRSVYAGVDVVGEIFFPKHKKLRRSTVQRMKARMSGL